MTPTPTQSVTGFRVVAWWFGLSTLGNLGAGAWRVLHHRSFFDPSPEATVWASLAGLLLSAMLIAALRASLAEKQRRGKSTRFVVDRQFLVLFIVGAIWSSITLVVHIAWPTWIRDVERVLELLLVVSLLAFSAQWIWAVERHLVRERRHIAGACLACGYDLRATAERCPECGTPAPCPGTPGEG